MEKENRPKNVSRRKAKDWIQIKERRQKLGLAVDNKFAADKREPEKWASGNRQRRTLWGGYQSKF